MAFWHSCLLWRQSWTPGFAARGCMAATTANNATQFRHGSHGMRSPAMVKAPNGCRVRTCGRPLCPGLPRASPSPGERSRRTGRGVLGMDGLGRTSSLRLTASCGRKEHGQEATPPDPRNQAFRTKERTLRTRKPTVAGRFETSGQRNETSERRKETSGQGNGAIQTEWAAEGGRPGSAGQTGRHVGGIAADWGRRVDAAFFVPTPGQPR